MGDNYKIIIMKYKLKQIYPGSPKLGYIASPKEDNAYYVNSNWIQLENYPEFWELIVEKDYEILSYIHNGSKHIWKKDPKFETYFYINQGLNPCTRLEDILKYPKIYLIYSIKRLSDGEIFTIGDNTNAGIIKQFNICGNTLQLEVDGLIFLDNYLIKKIKQPLFTTKDSVNIFEGDTFYWLDKGLNIKNSGYTTIYTNVPNTLYFSTKEKAEEYILLNKPCLSINDVAKVFVSTNYTTNKGNLYPQGQKLRDLVKSKINNK